MNVKSKTIDVDRIAELSKLEISDDKKALFEKQMRDIVAMADTLSEVDDIEIFDERYAALRDDSDVNESTVEIDYLSSAPCSKNGYFCVPKTVG